MLIHTMNWLILSSKSGKLDPPLAHSDSFQFMPWQYQNTYDVTVMSLQHRLLTWGCSPLFSSSKVSVQWRNTFMIFLPALNYTRAWIHASTNTLPYLTKQINYFQIFISRESELLYSVINPRFCINYHLFSPDFDLYFSFSKIYVWMQP